MEIHARKKSKYWKWHCIVESLYDVGIDKHRGYSQLINESAREDASTVIEEDGKRPKVTWSCERRNIGES